MSMNRKIQALHSIIVEANAGALYPDLSMLKLSKLDDPRMDQSTIYGTENHRIKTYLAILFMPTMRDFTDTDTGVYKSHDAVDDIVRLCESEKELRIRIRAQIRRALNSPRWQYNSPIEKTWTCTYCGCLVRNDREGINGYLLLSATYGGLPPTEASANKENSVTSSSLKR
jgi:hypothetical protein